MKVYTIYLDGMRGPTEKNLAGILGGIEGDLNELPCMAVGEEMTFRVVVGEMTEEAYEALPEFAGY